MSRRGVRQFRIRVAPAPLTIVALACLACLLGGCEDGRVIRASVTAPVTPNHFVGVTYRADGVALAVPANWTVTAERAPLVAVVSSGLAVMALWRYHRSGPAITGTGALMARLGALEKAAQTRDRGLRVLNRQVSSLDGAGAVILDAITQIAGQTRRVRSEHIYVDGGELVFETYAPVASFSAVDREAFSPARRSLTLLHSGGAA